VTTVTPSEALPEPTILDRSDHIVSRRNIDSDAQKVLYRLERAGFETYLVGGGVRDLLLRRRPKDYDVATSARPEEVRRLFRNSRIIGRRFRLAHVYFRGSLVEVSTFRAAPDRSVQRGGPKELLVTNDNTYGTPREDAFRRDFTINALYYRVSDYAVVDYVGGLEDLGHKLIRVIGDPDIRFQEDPVRMLRCCELAARLGFRIDPAAQQSIRRNRHELEKAAPPRIRGRPGRLDDVVLLASILAPRVFAEVAAREGTSGRPLRARDAVHAATSEFMKRLAVPNARSLRATRALEVLLRLQEMPEDPWERSQITRFAAFDDALRVLKLLTRATGQGADLYQAWKAESRNEDGGWPTGKRRRRRSRARRQRRAG